MNFNTESERLQHPQAKLIPESIWNARNYFNKQLVEKDKYFLTESLDVIFNEKYDDMDEKQKKRVLLSVLIRYPDTDINKLLLFATNKLNLDEIDFFFCVAVVGDEQTLKSIANYFDSNELQKIIQRCYCLFFDAACMYSQVTTLNWIKEVVPKEMFEEMVKNNDYSIFAATVKNDRLDAFKWLCEVVGEDKLSEVIKADDYQVFRAAIDFGKLEALKFLKEIVPEEWGKMIGRNNYQALVYAIDDRNFDVVALFLLDPDCFAYAEQHDHEYGISYIYPLVAQQLDELHTRVQEFRLEYPNDVFDINDKEAKHCFYILRNLIRRNNRDLDDGIRLLLNIPAVKALAHQAVTLNQPNELVRLALTTGNTDAAHILLNIDAVRELAEQNNFYSNERRGQFDLRQLAQDRESSMTTLSTGEQKRLDAVIKEYSPIIEKEGVANLMDDLRMMLLKRYQKNPATVKIDDIEITLPAGWKEFQKLNLDKENYNNASKAYYQHKEHSALRYLSKPNHWMHSDASYVNENNTERWSTFEEYQPLIVMLWLAAIDENATPTDEMSLDGRLEHFIRELALIGRAHNWDKSRITKEGKEEEYDDLDKDRPSCFSGVKRRLFQSVIGHPLIKIVTINDIKHEFRDFVRTYFISQINEKNINTLKSALNDYYISLDNEDAMPLQALNIPQEVQKKLTEYLDKKYGVQFSEELTFIKYIHEQFKLTEKDAPSHLLKFIAFTQIDSYINKYNSNQNNLSQLGLFSSSGSENKMEKIDDKMDIDNNEAQDNDKTDIDNDFKNEHKK